MGEIKLYNADCLEIMKNMPDGSIDLIVTDPPYRITSYGNAGNSGGMMQKKQSLIGKIFEYNDISCKQYAPEFYRLLKDGSHCYVMSNHVNLIEMLNTFTDVGFHFIKSLIWDKQNKIMGRFYMSQFEYILFFRKGRGVQINDCGTGDVLSIPNIKTKDRYGNNLHDTEKPVELMKILVKNSSDETSVVLDPFMGSGSTGVACKRLNRNFIGIEIDKDFYDIANERITNEASSIRMKRVNKLF